MSAPLPDSLERLIDQLSRLPGVGRKTATRLAFHLVNHRQDLAPNLSEALRDMADRVRLCERCYNISEDSLCPVCADERRSEREICVVEGIPELLSVELSGRFRGGYHVLHGLLSPMRGVGPDALRLDRLKTRCQEGGVAEVVVATSLTSDGETTALFIKKLLTPLDIRITRLASGVPFGGSIEFADARTLSRALDDRRTM